jgi:hypothetical protein
MGQPIRQRNIRVVGTPEHFEILQLGVAEYFTAFEFGLFFSINDASFSLFEDSMAIL